MKSKSYYIILSILISFPIIAVSTYNPATGKRIGKFEEGQSSFIVDTVGLKKDFEQVLDVPEVTFDKIEILKRTTAGEIKEEYFMLIAYDYSHKLKMARWLTRKDNNLYYYKDNTNNESDDAIFFRTYFVCFGTDTECFPQIIRSAKEYTWSSSGKILCEPDNPCQALTIFDPEGE